MVITTSPPGHTAAQRVLPPRPGFLDFTLAWPMWIFATSLAVQRGVTSPPLGADPIHRCPALSVALLGGRIAAHHIYLLQPRGVGQWPSNPRSISSVASVSFRTPSARTRAPVPPGRSSNTAGRPAINSRSRVNRMAPGRHPPHRYGTRTKRIARRRVADTAGGCCVTLHITVHGDWGPKFTPTIN